VPPALFPPSTNDNCRHIAVEKDALLSFKAGITSDPSRRLRSWRGQDCRRWHGVSCSTRTGHVVKLDLRNNFFLHDLLAEGHAAVHWLRGRISSSLAVLRRLKHLDLNGNDLGANMPVPEFTVSLKTLPEIGSMPSVRTFAECFLLGTRQTHICRVLHSA
jgi:hypothetical protein